MIEPRPSALVNVSLTMKNADAGRPITFGFRVMGTDVARSRMGKGISPPKCLVQGLSSFGRGRQSCQDKQLINKPNVTVCIRDCVTVFRKSRFIVWPRKLIGYVGARGIV